MPKKNIERPFNRRAFILFLLIGPAAVLTLFALIFAAQYKQLRSIVSSHQGVKPYVWNSSGRARLDSLKVSLHSFSSSQGPDTLHLSAHDLEILAAASPVLQQQRLHVRFTDTDSLLIVESTQSVEDQNRKFSWIFKKLIPVEFQYLNARLEGLPQWKGGILEFVPERGFLNGGKVPRGAMIKRAGMSPRDFIDSTGLPAYKAFLSVLDTTYYDGHVTLVRGKPASRPLRGY